jgi:hypothetical protein
MEYEYDASGYPIGPRGIDEANQAMLDGDTPPFWCVDAFLDEVQTGTFDAQFERLVPRLKWHVIQMAKGNIHELDDIVADLVASGNARRAESFAAFKEWAYRQPWLEEALAVERVIPWTEEQQAAWNEAEYAMEVHKRAVQAAARIWAEDVVGIFGATVADLERRAKVLRDRSDALLGRTSATRRS